MAQLTRLSRLITICQRAAKAIPLISHTDRAETSGTDRADCDGTRFAEPPFWQKPQPVLRSVAFPSEVPSIRELFFGESRGLPCSRFLRLTNPPGGSAHSYSSISVAMVSARHGVRRSAKLNGRCRPPSSRP